LHFPDKIAMNLLKVSNQEIQPFQGIKRILLMQKALIVGLYLFVLLFPFTGHIEAKTIRLYDESKISAKQAASLFVPSDIEILRIDDRKLDSSFSVIRKKYEIQLASGDHQLIIRYNNIWEYDTSHNFEKVRSNEIVVVFRAEEARHYNVTHPLLRDIKEAQKFAENPEIRIEEIKTKARVSTSGQNKMDVTPKPAGAIEPPPKNKSKAAPAKNSDQLLKKDWENMSEEEKKQFKEWMEKKDSK
jgi:uncharacterized protein YccT (UPF0319 family)